MVAVRGASAGINVLDHNCSIFMLLIFVSVRVCTMLVVARLPLGDKKTGFERVSI